MIKNIVFDIGMVLADFRYEAYMMDDLGFSREVTDIFTERLVMNRLWNDLDLSIRDYDEIVAEMKAAVSEYPEEADQFFSHLSSIAMSYPYSKAWVEEMQSRGYRAYLLSNYPERIYTLHERERFDFAHVVDGKVISGYEKVAKPDPRIYQILCERYQLIPQECVFIDDRDVNIEAAKAYGMKGIVFHDYAQARADLSSLLQL